MVLHEDTPTFIAITVVGIVLIENAILYALLAQLIWQVLRGAAATLRFLSRLHDRIGNVRFVLTLSAVAIIIGLLVRTIINGPIRRVKEARLDTRRLYELARIQSGTVMYWEHQHSLADRMDQLSLVIYGFKPPDDPESGRRYEYIQLGTDSFELCATFSLPLSSERAGRIETSPDFKATEFVSRPQITKRDWSHPVGHFCFLRTLDNATRGSPPNG